MSSAAEAVARLYQTYTAGLILTVLSHRGAVVVEDWTFRLIRHHN